MKAQATDLRLEIHKPHNNFFYANVIVPTPIINGLYKEASRAQRDLTHIPGFLRGNTPLAYVETTFKKYIVNHLQEFLIKYLITGYLYQELRAQKLFFAGEPRLEKVELEPDKDATFTFLFTGCEPLPLRGWKYYSFKPPKRKNYRDLDRQVEFFLKAEEEAHKSNLTKININDWVCFDITTVDHNKKPIFGSQNCWLRIGNEEVDIPFQELFCDKQVGEHFYSSASCFQEYFSNQLDTKYNFHISITDVVHDALFSLDDFKNHFRLRTNKEMHKKLIEVFSYRNDISQRRETVEEIFKLLLSQHTIDVPNHLVLWQQQALLASIQENPDYQVYRLQKDFNDKLYQLALKQIRETILMDQLAIKENIPVNHQDIKHYLNLIKRQRTKEFVYFDLPSTKAHGQEAPISTELLKHYTLREKTLNYVIYHLTRK